MYLNLGLILVGIAGVAAGPSYSRVAVVLAPAGWAVLLFGLLNMLVPGFWGL